MEFRSAAILLVALVCLDAKGEMFVADGYRLESMGEVAGDSSQPFGSSWAYGASLALTGDALVARVPTDVRGYDPTSGAPVSNYVPPVSTGDLFGGDLLGGVGIVADEKYTLIAGGTWQPVDGRYGVAHLYDTATGDFLRTLYSDQPLSRIPYLRSVAYDGQHAVVSLHDEGLGVYVFDIESGEQIANLVDPSSGLSNFGASIAIDGGIVVVGAPYELSADEGDLRGAVYTFDAATGTLINRWTPPSNAANGFGFAVAADDGVVIVGNDRHYSGLAGPSTSQTGTGIAGPDPDYAGDLQDDDEDEPQQEPIGVVYALGLHDGALLSTLLSSEHPEVDEYQTSEFGFTLRLNGHLAVVSKWDSDGDGVAEGTPLSVYDVRNGKLIVSFDENYYGGIAIDGNRIAALQAWGSVQGVPVIKVFAIVPEPNAVLLAIYCLFSAAATGGRRAEPRA